MNEIPRFKENNLMYDNVNFPIGTDNKEAPWNQNDNPEREVNVTISVTLSKTVKVRVSDYQIIDRGKDEHGEYFEDIDYSRCDLKKAVENQVYLPQDASAVLRNLYTAKSEELADDFSGWEVDDFEVIPE